MDVPRHAELRVEFERDARARGRLQRPRGVELLVGRMVGHPCQPHASGRLNDDREKQVELPVEPGPGDAYRHPHAARLTVGAALKDVDFADEIRAPGRVAIDRRDQGQTNLLWRRHDLRCFAVELPCVPHKAIPQMIPQSVESLDRSRRERRQRRWASWPERVDELQPGRALAGAATPPPFALAARIAGPSLEQHWVPCWRSSALTTRWWTGSGPTALR